MFPLSPKAVLVIFALPTLASVLLVIIGGILDYTPVPLFDMWSSFTFVTKAEQGDFSELWAQHNEHRILLTRALIFLDCSLFQGRGYFLEIVNYLLLFVICLTLCHYLQERLNTSSNALAKHIIALVMLTVGVSWLQCENLIWTFQSAFLLAQLLPLWAFYCLHKSHVAVGKKNLFFLYACLSGIFALGSMANGVITLPLLAGLAAILGMGWRKVTLLLILACGGVTIYFYGYHSPPGHGSLKDAVVHHPLEFVEYVLLYLGAPFYFLTGKLDFLVPQFAGAFLIFSALGFAWHGIKHPQQSSLVLALLMFIVYIGATAVGTAGGRLVFGIPQALAGRYMTPVLMVWSVMLILYAPYLIRKMTNMPLPFYGALFGLQLSFLSLQLAAMEPHPNQLYDYKVAALAVEMGIYDQQQTSLLYPNASELLNISLPLIEKNIGIFGYSGIKDVRNLIGTTEMPGSQQSCVGGVDGYQRLDGQPYMRFSGWLFDLHSSQKPQYIHVLNDAGTVVGYAFTGLVRDDLRDRVHVHAHAAGFKGYLLAEYVGQNIVLNGHNPDCHYRTMVNLSAEDRAEAFVQALGQHLGINVDPSDISANAIQVNFPSLNEVKISIGGRASRPDTSTSACHISIHDYRDIMNDRRYVRIKGELEYSGSLEGEIFEISDSAARVIGFGVSSKSASTKPPVARGQSFTIKFDGYLLEQQIGKSIMVKGMHSRCTLQTSIKRLPFKVSGVKSIHLNTTANNSQILENNQWLGTDPQRTEVHGFKVWSSYIHAELDKGSISLALQRGDSVFYRSGNTGGRQTLFISGQPEPFMLPVAIDWVVIEFLDDRLPSKFTVTFADEGSEWGEWSAIGLRSNN